MGSLGITVELAEKPVSCSANLLKTLSRVLSYISVCTATPKDPLHVLLFLIVHSGRMEATCPARKDAEHYLQALQQFRSHHRHLGGGFLIQDGDPSHTAAATTDYFNSHPWWRPRFTPAHTSWLNQAELLNDAFSYRHLKRRSWHSRQELIDRIDAAWPEYNQLYAHPFEWTWTNQKMRRW